jgi:3-hydroxyacyl-[acyl-carrier-protein] dehydratase
VPGSFEMRFASDHPTAAGHFPGNPIIPGALALDAVLDAIAGDDPVAQACEIRAVKFLRPIRPGDRIRIDWHEERGDTRFQCVLIATDDIALTGTLRLGGKPK